MFTKEDLDAKYQEFLAEETAKYEEEKAEFEALSYSDIKKEFWRYDYIVEKDSISGDVGGCLGSDVVEVLEEFKNSVATQKHGEITLKGEACCDEDSAYVRFIFFSCEVLHLKDDNAIEIKAKTKIKNWAKAQLKPQSVGRFMDIDYKLLELFKQGKIDFNDLQKLVYSDYPL